MKKLFFSDLDGTLLSRDKSGKVYIKEENIKSIKEYQSKGHDFAIATGRANKDVETLKMKYNFKTSYSIVNNGAIILKDGEKIYDKSFNKEKAIKIIELLDKKGYFISFSDGVDNYKKRMPGVEIHEHAFAIKGSESIILNDIIGAARDSNIITSIGFSPIINVTNKKINPRELKIYENKTMETIEYIKDEIYPELEYYFSLNNNVYVDLSPDNVSKGNAIKWLIEQSEEKWKMVGAVGDAMNDYEMLAYVEYGYKMKNGNKELTKVAKKEIAEVFNSIDDFEER